ncbi:MAG: hypothetical protein LAP87_30235 [Acidobacteriia bacterium]|nr:hypothetical protein [Terriglobia bacterium]
MMNTRKYWPLDYDPEVEIYDNVAWDLPGFRLPPGSRSKTPQISEKRKPRP